MPIFKNDFAGDRGANMVEYSLIVALVALMAFAAVTLLGDRTADTFTTAAVALGDGQPHESGSVDAGGSGGSDSTDSGSNNDGSNNGASDQDQNSDDQGQSNDDQGQSNDDQGQSNDDQGQSNDDQGQNNDDQGQSEDQDQEQLELPSDDQDDTGAGSDDGNQDGQSGGADEDTEDSETQGETGPASTGTASELYWWDSHNTKGQWKASVSYKNETNRHQYLTLEITKTDDKGKTTTTTVKDFYVGAGTSSTYTDWNNDIDKDGKTTTGTLKVAIRVISVRTSDENWKTYSYDVNGAPASVTVPSLP